MTHPARNAALRTGNPLASGSTASAAVDGVDSRHWVRSQDLLGPGAELWIEHNSKHYRLRVTAQGKLILTA